MDSYRQLQAEKWRREKPAQPLPERPAALSPEPLVTSPFSILTVDESSLESIRSFLLSGEWKHRTGLMFGALGEDGYSIIVDAIYECSQDPGTGQPLRDTRLPLVLEMNKLMNLQPVGILVTREDLQLTAEDFVRAAVQEGGVARVILVVGADSVGAVLLTDECVKLVREGKLQSGTTLTGRTVNGGVDAKELQKPLAVVKRTVNTIVHTGFYRLNRPNHTPTADDARAFILARRQKVGIEKLHLQLADYHLILFLADLLGQSAGERIILSIYQEEDELAEDLIELLMSSTDEQLG